jgi:glycosidase
MARVVAWVPLLFSLLLGAVALGACTAIDDEGTGTSDGVGGSVGSATPQGPASSGQGGAGGSGSSSSGQGGQGAGGPVFCSTTFRFEPTFSLQNPRVAGEWQGFDEQNALPLEDPDGDGVFEGSVDLAPGFYAYKLVYEVNGATEWVFDPDQGRRKYDSGVENSGMRVADCSKPSLEVESHATARVAPGQGTFDATLRYVDGLWTAGADPTQYDISLSGPAGIISPSTSEVSVAANGDVAVSLADLADGKYTLRVRPTDGWGAIGEVTRLVFWIEAERYDWRDALVYMVMTDRFRDGDPSNNPGATSGADPRGDWQGGDLEGVRQAIADGSLDQLGVRAIWLTPFSTNPPGAYIAADGVHLVTGYHGYWPTMAREVDARLGGAAALHAMVAEAHKHGIRVLADYVINHVHEDHEYVAAHSDWFRTGCVCGTNNCGWTSHALECLFRDYMPDVDQRVPEAGDQWVDDAIWWLDTFDLDGLRVDAVKHVEEGATRNLAAAVRETFEKSGTRYFLMGETAMGWSDCADPCNDENYGTIARYVGPHGLDGQFDFVLYHGVSYQTFAYGDKGMLHADYWFQHGQTKWPEGAIMTPYIGSHDTPRFASLANYRGQDGAHDRSIPNNQWSNIAGGPSDAEPHRRMRIAMSWLLTLPGAPLLYYGDEYGEWGGADPNNRVMWRDEGQLDADELTTLAHVRKLGSARQQLVALRRGGYQSLYATDDTLVFARVVQGGPSAIVALTRSNGDVPVTVDAASAGLAANTSLTDAMGGSGATVAGDGSLDFTVPAGGAVILAP